MDDQDAPQVDHRLLTRRGFFARTIWGLGGLMAAVVLGPLVGFAVSPALKRGATAWTEIGKLSQVPDGVPTRLEYTAQVVDGWVTEAKRSSAWVVRQGADVVVFSPACTHLGCAYKWNPGANRFECPCHNGLFAKDGTVLGGPPPRPLDRYEVRAENGKLYIGSLNRKEA